MKIGIDKIGFATSQYVLKLDDLALARQTDPAKFSQGLLIEALSVTPVTEDIVTLAASAADQILTDEDKATIDMVILATESSVDQSKAAAIYVHHLMGIQPFARSFEVKEACYSATAALDYAKLHVAAKPESRVLVIASDIAKYGIDSAGESTQGAGSIAMLITANPRILELHQDNVAQTRDIMDFWRPNYSTTPFVNGVYSTKQYLDSLETTWQAYQDKTGAQLTDFAAFCFHLPFPKLALKGLNKMMDESLPVEHKEHLLENFQASITYSKQIGNIYTGSLYLGLLSLLENSKTLQAGDRIGLFSYGSGAVSEIFSGQLVAGYEQMLMTNRQTILDQRHRLSVAEYEELFYEEAKLDEQGNASFNTYLTSKFALTEIKDNQRLYQINDKYES
ncbi:hydroxymethylglutaryl-CoA synthase [Streptococcus dysgalactiae subsp. equisimilis]|uniref:HMG-CoA synthase n=1 Tax=Streptococcus dysgalactiae subsp. equisimilis TaxID=119602 RepID=A0AAE9QYK0_STREQ|nr:hydroxymethylglutaryl-CoA synthase [Streptococcus dysgalactiae]ADX24401.1 HMG-CoA synthase [Streptococcus dysgalactiae subsp. equisimilis ATCC 12394]EGR88889.1 hydroxymethylglutaryl-CoA synthase [Streptococcus dysgalactiae subsp. equisimilis SK1250]KKC17190.1 DNA-binding protein [Streptococcus dysgalactiae subsp. equisimilis]KKC22124.1 DNA-binding protein [Streptococcus dysgalactiae subsp. equisimilis]MBM6513798.1 hydroxymethylglutaryl-CoA synthase [Streptococcus dysgalactiae subsp. equisim